MAEEFLSDRIPADAASDPERESIRVIVVGSRRGVTTTIQTLHFKTFAAASEWSRLQPEPMTGEWMSIVTKTLQFE